MPEGKSTVPEDLLYSEDHEWVRKDGDTLTVGITDYAQEQLTDIVFVELPDLETRVAAGDGVAVLESVKSVADVYSPVSGEIVEVNELLEAHPERINEDPYGEGWIYKIKAPNASLTNLMEPTAYAAFVEAEQQKEG